MRQLKLRKTVKVDGVEVDILNIRQPIGRDLRAVRNNASGMDFVLDIGAACAEVPPSTIDQLDIADAVLLSEIVSSFLGVSPPTGKT